MQDLLAFVKNVYFFKGLDENALAKIASVCHQQTFAKGEIIFREGDVADKFYIVLRGAIEVWKDYDTPEPDMLAIHTSGHLFGEMALIDELPRSATVIAREQTEVLYISRTDFHKIIMADSAIALSIMKSVSAMVRKSNESFVEGLREKNRNLEKANRELKETQAELLRAERLSALGKFSSLILHDIRNPLSIIRGYAELIRVTPQHVERVKNTATKIMAEADRINRLANELLDYSRGEIRLNISIVTPQDLINDLLPLIEDRFKTRQIVFETELGYQGPLLLDRERFGRALFNLADNARKAMPEGGVFKIRVFSEDKTVFWEISDTGIGMTEEIQQHIFEPFTSFSEGGGTGLGMCIVKSIIEAHDGNLKLFSKPHAGTRFVIALPLMN